MAAVEFVEIAATFERVGEVKNIKTARQVFDVVMEVSSFFFIVENEYVVVF